MRSVPRYVAAILAAGLTTGAAVSTIQSQVVLSEIADLGTPISASVRVWTTLADLASFGPVMFGIAVAALLPAVMTGHMLLRASSLTWRSATFALTVAVWLWVAFWLMRSVIPMPAIPGTRDQLGHVLMSLAGAVGGVVYARLTSPSNSARSAHPWRYAVIAGALVAVPGISFLATSPAADPEPIAVDPRSYSVQTVLSGLNRPWSVAFLPDGRALLTEMGGRLLAIEADGASTEIALEGLPPIFRLGGVIGLMEVALDPEFTQNSFIYLTMGYGDSEANGTRLVRAKLAGERIEDVRVLFSSTPKPRAGNNGGRIAFLGDGTLVMTVGDGSSRREEAQNPANHLGTVVRLDRDGRPPQNNPFTQKAGTAPEIYSLGHRNAQGIAVDPRTGDLLISEHGARGGDEVNLIVPGGNYGWPVVTGGIDYPFARITPFRQLEGYQDAILEWTPSIAPAGLAVYQGSLFPEWRGDLLVPALKERSVRRVVRDGQRIIGQQLLLAELNERMRDVKVAPDGSIYVLTDGVGAKLLRLVPTSTKG